MYRESLDILEHHIKPVRAVPGVVLEQTYLNKMADGVKPLAMLAGNDCEFCLVITLLLLNVVHVIDK